MLKLEKLTRVENGGVVGAALPVGNASHFIRSAVGADTFAVWRRSAGKIRVA